MDWNGIWQTIKDFFVNKWPVILGFFAALIIGFIVVKILIKVVRKLLSKTRIDKIAQKFLMSLVKIVLWLIYIIMLLSILGVSITGIVAAFSAAVLAIGLALQNALSSVANGIIIVSSKIFQEGDYINVAGVEGTVKNINLLATTIVTVDNKTVTLPNSTVVNSPMTNYSKEKTRRVDLTFDLAYETDIMKAKKVLLDVVESDGRIYKDPAPFCSLNMLGASSIQLVLRVWVDKEDYWNCYFYILENAFNELKRNNISIPYNQLEVRMRTDKVKMPYEKAALPKRVEKERLQEEHHGIFGLLEGDKNKKKREKKADKKLEKLENKQSETKKPEAKKEVKTKKPAKKEKA